MNGLFIALDRIAREAEERTGFLDLGRLGLSALPEQLFALKNLRRLNLGRMFRDELRQWHESVSSFADNSFANDLDGLANLEKLQCLWLSGIDLERADAISALTSLQELDCSLTQVRDIGPLKALPSLQKLNCSSTQVRNLDSLKALSNLQEISCSFTRVSDLDPLKALRKLQVLDFLYTKVSDLSPLKALQNLQQLGCSSTQVSDLGPLTKLPDLQRLHCSSTQVSDLGPLYALLNLQELDCSSTQVSDLGPLKALANLQQLDCSSTPVSNLGPLEALANLQELDCSSTQVSDLGPLKALRTLQTLDCSSTRVSDLNPLKALPALQTLSCWSTSVKDLGPLKALSSLRYLDCSMTLASDLGPLEALSNLQDLECSSTPVRDLGPLKALTTLRTLECAVTPVSDLAPLKDLPNLQKLNCRSTQVSDLGPVKDLSSLQTLNCSSTKVNDLSPLMNLTALHQLYFWSTPVSDLSPLKALRNLQDIDCESTAVSDLGPLRRLANLRELNCASTAVSDLGPLKALPNLQDLNCSKCRLSSLDESFWFKASLDEVSLFETRIPGIPAEVLSDDEHGDCLVSLRAHLRDLGTDPEPMRDVKLMVLGNGRIGKTQMCRRLRGEDFDERVESTHGILVTSAALPQSESHEPTCLQIWDFGGQDIYHGTHALFTRSRAIFALVWIPEAEETAEHVDRETVFRNRPLTYWLDYVRHFATTDSSILVVQTRCEKPEEERFPPASAEALDAFAFRKLLYYSAFSNRGRAALDEALIDATAWLHAKQGIATIGKGRAKVKRELERLRDEDAARPVLERKFRTITHQHFLDMCQRAGDITDASQLLAYLHNAGTVFYRRGLFGERIILDQGWALEAIYAVFHREKSFTQIKRQRGRFTRSDLAEWIWDDAGHSAAEQALFLSMMQSCGICFEYRSAEHKKNVEAEYIAPDLLPERSEIAMLRAWDEHRPIETAIFQYDLLPPGLMSRLISRIGNDAGLAAEYWRDGVYFFEKETQSWALIEQETTVGWQGLVRVRTQGGQAALLLEKTAALVEEQQNRIGVTPRRSQKPVATAPATKDALAGETETAKSLQITQEPRLKPEYFVSYAWGDNTPEGRDRESTVDRICADAEARGVTVLRDKKVLELGDRISKFMQRLGSGDRIVIVLSAKYLESPYCMYELSEIWRNCRQDDVEFLKKIRIFTLPDAKIWTIEDRAERAIHWLARRNKLKAMIKEHGDEILGDFDSQQYRLMRRFVEQIGDMLATMADIVQPRSFDDFNKYGFD
ncbi:MAG TPA: leucine-rich repeat domain-containing protein [Steroidobacteraceae bacterium]|nr:leucine-rich repeat domain-containing protein [Steroidobacteraceae bacterium]